MLGFTVNFGMRSSQRRKVTRHVGDVARDRDSALP
jgi:hypothetical protein